MTLPMKTLNLRIVSRSGGSVTVGRLSTVLNSSTFNINWHLVNKRIFPK